MTKLIQYCQINVFNNLLPNA